MLESLAANQIEERDRRLDLREDIEILFRGQQQVHESWELRHQRTQEDWEARQRLTQSNIEAINAQIATLTALATADRAQVMADRAAEAQVRADFIAQMVGLQTEVKNILRELADLRRQGNGHS